MAMVRLPILGGLTLICAFCLQGCNVAVPRHAVGNWEAKPSYLSKFQYDIPGKPKAAAILNSCSDPSISAALQCNGQGQCRDWNDMVPGANPNAPRLAFCECNRDYADPECTTERKSQVTAFVLSIFFGYLGVDEFYLGHNWYGVGKLVTLGGAGIWYLYDICRIGSSAVETSSNFRVAADLPHFAFVLTVVTLMLFFGFAISMWSIQSQRVKKAHELLLLRMDQQDAQEQEQEKQPPPTQPQYSMRQPSTVPLRSESFSGYGAVIPPTTSVVSRSMAPPPVTLPVQPMSRPVMTAPPTATTLQPTTTRSFVPTPPILNTGVAPVTLPYMGSMASTPITEYSVPGVTTTLPPTRGRSASPVRPVSSALPVVQGIRTS